MEIAIMVLLVLVPMVKQVIKIAADRSRAKGEAELIQAEGAADLARAHGEAEVIRAQAQLRPRRGQNRG